MRILLLVIALLALSGCLMTRDDIQKQDDERQLKEQVTTIQRSRADSEQRYSDLEQEIRAVSGRAETIEHNQQNIQLTHKQDTEGIKKAIEAQSERIKAIEQHLDTLDAKLTSAIQAMANAPAGAPVAQQSEAPPASVSTKKPDGKLFAEGEALFSRKEFKKALVKFQGYREKYPKGPKAAESTYKIGVCLGELGLKKEAKEIFQETVESYPGSSSAKKAKFRLTQLR